VIGLRRWLLVLAVLAGLLLAADRVAATAAEHVVASRIQRDQGLTQRPHVSIHGFPFLTQAIGGRYDHVSLTLRNLHDRPVPVSNLAVDLRGVHVPLGAVLSQHLTRVPVDRATATILVSYSDLNDFLGDKHIVVSRGSADQIKVSGTATVLGRTVSASGSGRIDVQGSDIVVTVGQGLDFSVPLGGLPFRIALVGAKATNRGIEVDATASGLVLHPNN
jgi:hypothetical protein